MASGVQTELAGQPVLILREGTGRARGREAQHANIMAAKIVAESVKSVLGPKGMDKMLVDAFGDVSITNDGATILGEMEVQHPIAKMMVEVAKTQDKEVGDGTTTAVILAGELLSKAEELIEKEVHPTVVIDGYRKATEKALEYLDKLAIPVKPTDKEALKKIAVTSMAGKLVAENKEYLADLAVAAVLQVALDTNGKFKVDIDDIKTEKKVGDSITSTKLIQGIVLDKEVVHSGMPKRVDDAKIALLDCPLEIEKTEFDAKINIENPEQMKAFINEEEHMLSGMVEKIAKTGANVVICQKGIDDLAQHQLARKGILAVRRVKASDVEKLAKAAGAKIVNSLDSLSARDLGYAKLVEERKLGEDKWTFIEGCKNPKAVTILVRGSTDRIVDEAERSLHDGLMVVRDVVQEPKIVAGGGAPEAEVAHKLREYAQKLSGKEQLAVIGFAEALEAVPTILAENAGLDPIDIIVELRSRHDKGEKWAGIDSNSGKVQDMGKLNVYEPIGVKNQIIKSASEATTMILKIDDVIAASKVRPGQGPPGGMEGAGAGEEF